MKPAPPVMRMFTLARPLPTNGCQPRGAAVRRAIAESELVAALVVRFDATSVVARYRETQAQSSTETAVDPRGGPRVLAVGLRSGRVDEVTIYVVVADAENERRRDRSNERQS